MTTEHRETADLPKGWPFPDLPANTVWERVEHGVFHDRRERGHGIQLAGVTTDLTRALDSARALDGKGHVRSRRVIYSAWSGPIYDDREVATPPTQSPAGGGA